ncbi:cobalt ABC transporter, ATP-binding protein [Peptostreptococcaceae bacterium AS15]|nr:ABC transporter, ATP-binding protein [[Eubacterium] yurii subsp. margaretiae ATCC 43715]EJP19494.1 cobalt ABC transporter, ATP-binding protein [Peptostreptococcaceae bacterium AS15]
MSSFIDVKNLIYEYKNVDSVRRAVNNLNIQIQKGRFIVVLGHNGSGKSTFAKHLNAIFTPTSGTVLIDGLDTNDDNKVFEIRQKCGMVFQNPDNQIVATVVEDDVAFGPENMGVPSQEIRKRVDDALSVVRMSEFATKAPHLLSGGQKQKVAIAGIIAMKPDCIILDESTSMLDPRGRKEVMSTVKKLNKEENITLIHITHFMEEAVDADYIYVMEEGEIVLEGTPKEVFVNIEQLQNLGLDVPPMTLLCNELKKQDIHISQDILTVEEMIDSLCQLKSQI